MDFSLTSSGDLLFERKTAQRQLALSFRVGEHKGLTLKFHVLNEKQERENKGLCLTFKQVAKSDLTHQAKVILDVEEKIQRIRLALSTQKGDIRKKESFGSLLGAYKHMDIHDSNVQANIQRTVLEAVDGLLQKPSVKVIPEKGQGSLYFHNVSVYIFEDKIQLFKFYL